ncbi:hypothetical protein M427DRAFT_175811 [Gonapodya prolifera JEL478]|uniref:Uncharacterized protein n=1 Tax=Gonapodya prolifera (strain JEL478) TaxID=1344416 RepID=A0A139B0T2_GONPJ|nr:hypothetical protein M427DRAFT_175811 [Gonapodya prolifera JEL478]|eukprot:KXS22589.1 hypothetical protein M427DRAFT_175811 [Gonapodya prolifera JEL478]
MFGFKPTLPPSNTAPAAPPPKPVKRFNPFLPPQPELLVGPAEEYDFNVVLNKFTVVKDHILLTTKAFKNQSCLLSQSELYTLWKATLSFESERSSYLPDGSPNLAPDTQRAFAFHNNGVASGCSVHHRHLQILPWGDMPIADLIRKAGSQKLGVPFTLPSLPFVHSVVLLPASLRQSSHVPTPETGAQLYALYMDAYEAAYAPLGYSRVQLVDHFKGFDEKLEDFHETALSSNFIMTREFIYVTPRTQTRNRGIHVHSMGMAGLLVATSEEELAEIRSHGPMDILKGASVVKDAVKL